MTAPVAPPHDDRRAAAHHGHPERGWVPARLTTLAVLAVVFAPLRLAVAAVRTDAVPVMPDLHETLLATMAAEHLDQFVGPWSRLGLYHPGPMQFYWSAPFLAATGGRPSGLIVAALILVATCSAIICVAVARCVGPTGAVVAAGVLVAAQVQLTVGGLARPWNPTMLIFPVAAGLVAAAAAIHLRSLAWGLVAATAGAFVAQAHIGAVPIGAAIWIAAVPGAVVRPAPRAATDRRPEPGPSGPANRWDRLRPVAVAWGRPLLVAVVIAAPWVPVAIDQVAGTGNAGSVVRYGLTGHVDARFPPRQGGPSLRLSSGEALERVTSMVALTEWGSARWGGASFRKGLVHQPSSTSPVVALSLVGLAFLGCRRRGWPSDRAAPASRPEGDRTAHDAAPFTRWLCRLSLGAAVIVLGAGLHVRSEFRFYLVSSASGVGIVLWLAAGLLVAPAIERMAHRAIAIGAVSAPTVRRRAGGPAPAVARSGWVLSLALVALFASAAGASEEIGPGIGPGVGAGQPSPARSQTSGHAPGLPSWGRLASLRAVAPHAWMVQPEHGGPPVADVADVVEVGDQRDQRGQTTSPPKQADRLAAELPRLGSSRTFVVAPTTPTGLTSLQLVVEALERRQVRVRVVGPFRARFSDRQRDATGTGPRIESLPRQSGRTGECSVVAPVGNRQICIVDQH